MSASTYLCAFIRALAIRPMRLKHCFMPASPPPDEHSISLNKYISSTGRCSRREADDLIEAGSVTINGQATRKGNRVFPGDVVAIRGEVVQLPTAPRLYLAFNKPVGIVCTTDPRERKNIISYIKHPERLFPVGRLDKDSEGLIFLTNDGDIVNKILRAGNGHEKEYIVTVDKPITNRFIRRMSDGLPVLDTITLPCEVIRIDERSFRIILTQGLNRQIRRMCNFLGYEVTKLVRVRIMNIRLDGINTGKWRPLSEQEVKDIEAAVADSSKTAQEGE